MAKPLASFPRLHVERLPEPLPPLAEGDGMLDRYCRAFFDSTGWKLRYNPNGPCEARALYSRNIGAGSLSLEKGVERESETAPCSRPTLSLSSAERLADAFGSVLAELERTRHALWQREAELAAGVPVAARADSGEHLADRLEAVLKAGAQAVGCEAAGLYLLDDATSELKLRACCGLPKERLLEPARPLRGAMADLEALVGHAVVLEDVSVLPHWKVPEEYPSAVCVPVSSPTTPLGTLWIFSQAQRDFSAEQTNLIEIIAGRIASDLEREILLQAGSESQQLSRQVSAAADWQRTRLPHAPPLLDAWQLAGWTSRDDALAGSFHDWLMLPDGSPAALVGGVAGQGVTGALSAAALQAAAKAHAVHAPGAGELLTRVEEFFTAASPGDELGSLCFARLDPQSGRLEYTAAGNLAGWLVNEAGCRSLSRIGPELGLDQALPLQSIYEELEFDDSLVVLCRNAREQRGLALPTNLICESLFDRRRQSAAVQLDAVRAALASQARRLDAETSILVIKRRRGR